MIPIYRIPSITAYNRLEAAPRSTDLEASLSAEIRDPLWMLTRQWQFGEFQGEDAASPVTAMILGEQTPLDSYSPAGAASTAYDGSTPLETLAEAETLPDSLYLAVQIARYYARLLRQHSLGDYLIPLNTGYPLAYAIDPNDADGLQLLEAVGPSLFDGCAFLRAVGAGTYVSWLTGQGVPGAVATTLNGLASNVADWYGRNYSQPEGGASWEASSLDYSFALGSSSGMSLAAPQFDGGQLDWYDFDLASQGQGSGQDTLASYIPAPVTYKGMPNPRFWTMEDSQIDFGNIDTSPTGMLHLMLAEFGLVYGNDWFMLPYPMDINNLCAIKGLVVTDTFGEHVLVSAAGAGADNSWQRWAMFHQADTNAQATPNQLFYLAPTITQSLQDDPLEQVNFLRDEVADLVWAVEDTVPSQAGSGVSGNAMARKATVPDPFSPAGNANIRYIAGTTVPDNWIPFLPVHMAGSDTEIQFQRARMPGAKGALGRVLTEIPAPYYIREEEIPRAGVIVTRGFKRARWLNGKTFLWIGRTRSSGKGEGWSNLKFDQIVPITPAAQAALAPGVTKAALPSHS